MSCVAWPNQTPIGTASNFLQCKWISCSKSYWQGYDLGWYKDMGVPCFPQPNQQVSRRWAAAGKQEQVAASSSMEQQAAGKQQVSSRWAATGKQQQVSSSKQQQVAGKQQGSSRQAAGKQRASSNQRLPRWKNDQIYFKKINAIKKIELFPGARPQNEEIVQLLKVVVMPKLNFFQAHGLPIRLLRADTT